MWGHAEAKTHWFYCTVYGGKITPPQSICSYLLDFIFFCLIISLIFFSHQLIFLYAFILSSPSMKIHYFKNFLELVLEFIIEYFFYVKILLSIYFDNFELFCTNLRANISSSLLWNCLCNYGREIYWIESLLNNPFIFPHLCRILIKRLVNLKCPWTLEEGL